MEAMEAQSFYGKDTNCFYRFLSVCKKFFKVVIFLSCDFFHVK